MKQISIQQLAKKLPDLKNITESKSIVIGKWLIYSIESGLKTGDIMLNSALPLKADLAYFLGVSIGTVQNAFRYIEDLGYVESKQRVGTIIKSLDKQDTMRKLTSKREIAIEAVKKCIITLKLKVGDKLPSSRKISAMTGYSSSTTRLALECLTLNEIIERKFKNADKNGWFLKSLDFEINETEKNSTLVTKIETDLKEYIEKNLAVGEKMPAHSELSLHFNVSIKTIHDGLKGLISEGILLAKRGRYGTTVIKMPNDKTFESRKETSIYAPAKDAAFYYYEKTQNHIKAMIAKKYDVGDKLPSIMELSKELDLSSNTIRKAFHNLAKEGYLAFSRGRYGGTFVMDIPETEEQSFKWLAVNPKYAEVYQN